MFNILLVVEAMYSFRSNYTLRKNILCQNKLAATNEVCVTPATPFEFCMELMQENEATMVLHNQRNCLNSIVTQYMHYNRTFCGYMHIFFCQGLGADPGTELIPSHRTPASSLWLQVFVVSYGQLFSLPSDPVH